MTCIRVTLRNECKSSVASCVSMGISARCHTQCTLPWFRNRVEAKGWSNLKLYFLILSFLSSRSTENKSIFCHYSQLIIFHENLIGGYKVKNSTFGVSRRILMERQRTKKIRILGLLRGFIYFRSHAHDTS